MEQIVFEDRRSTYGDMCLQFRSENGERNSAFYSTAKQHFASNGIHGVYIGVGIFDVFYFDSNDLVKSVRVCKIIADSMNLELYIA